MRVISMVARWQIAESWWRSPPHAPYDGGVVPTTAARLNVTDNSFLSLEKGGGHMHVAGVLIFEGPPPPYEQVVARIQYRLDLVPRYRQKLADSPPLRLGGRPLWVDDPQLQHPLPLAPHRAARTRIDG